MKWNAEEIQIIEENQHLNSKEITPLLPGRTYHSIVQKRGKLGLAWTKELKWVDWEIELLKDNEHLSNIQISKSILPHRSYEAVKTARHKAGLFHIVRCNKCGTKIKKNNQFDICSDCKKTTKEYNSTINHRYSEYKFGAKRRGYSWELSLDQFIKFFNKNCTYCGDIINGIGIDRKDNSIGYIEGNCVPCCENCNRLKMDRNYNSWISHMKRILMYQREI